MKKRIVCMILILAFALSVFSGCILPVNTGRDLKQTIATVEYKGNVATITKLDAVQSFYTYGASYVQNYGMTEEDAFMYVIEQLANRKLLVLDAIDRGVVKGDNGAAVKWDNANNGFLKASLPAAIVNQAQQEVNEQIEEIYKKYVETVNEEYAEDEEETEEEETEEEDEDERTVRPLPVLDEEEEEEDYSETVDSWLNKTFNYETDWEEYGAISKNVARIAFNRVKKLFEDQYFVSGTVEIENIFLQSQYEQIIVEKLQESLLDGVKPTDAQVVARYAENLKKNEATFSADEAAYASAFGANQVLYYHPETGYATVKHVLLSFEEADLEDRKAENTHIYFNGNYSLSEYNEMASSGNYGEGNTALADYRAKLAETLMVNDYGKFEAWWDNGNGYDEEEMADLIDWRDLVYDKDNLSKVSGMDFLKGIHTELNGMDVDTKLEAFTNYIFGYSNPSDSGMFNNAYDYTVRPDEDSYMEEFTNICLYLISGKNAEDIEGDTDNYFVFGDETGKVGSMAICVTDYGIHLVMISHIANANTNEEGYYMIDTTDVAKAVAEMKKIEIGDTDRTTLYDYIYDTLKGAQETNKISVYQQNLINSTKDAVTINQDVVNKYFGK